MNAMIKLRSVETGEIIRSPHFWVIIGIISVLTVIYYAWQNWFPWFWHLFVLEYRYDLIGSLFFIPFLYAVLVFWWRGTLIIWLLSMTAMLPLIVYFSPNPASLVSNVIFPFFPLMVVAIIALQLKWRETERKRLAEREKERQVYMSQVFKAQEKERQRIAQELHDDTTQTLLVIANRAQALVSNGSCEPALEVRGNAEWIRDAVLKVSEGVRRLSLDLRPSILDEIGLVPAIRWLVDRFNQESDISAKILVKGEKRKLKPEADVIIFRIIQEALNNIRRHAEATTAIVTLKFTPTTLNITVKDNGKGFSLPKTTNKFTAEGKLGLSGMQQKAEFIDGALNIHSEPDKGTVVSLEVSTHFIQTRYSKVTASRAASNKKLG